MSSDRQANSDSTRCLWGGMEYVQWMLALGGACAFLHSVVVGKSDACPLCSLYCCLPPGQRHASNLAVKAYASLENCCRSDDASSVLGTSYWCQSDPIQNCSHCRRGLPGCWHAGLWSRNLYHLQWFVKRLACTTAIPTVDIIHTHVDSNHPYHLALPFNLAKDASSRLSCNKYVPP